MAKQEFILLAINESMVSDLIAKSLRTANYEVGVATDVSGLNKSIQEVIPALVIMAETFAERDGIGVANEILERFPTMPIILYANKDVNGVAQAVLKAGLSGYLYAPLKIDEIVYEVQRCLSRAKKLGDWVRGEVKRTTASLTEKAKISEAERIKLEAIIANIHDGVIVLDDKEQVLMLNQSVRETFRLGNKSLTGKWLREIISNADVHALLDRTKEGMLKYHEIHFDDGRVFNAQYVSIPRIGNAVTIQDISYLKELDRMKSDFIHTVSHDLRSPLTAILGYMELIERTGPLNENQVDFLQRLQGSVQHITNLINDFLDFGRLEAGFDTRREPVQVENVLQYALDVFDGELKKKKIKLNTKIAEDLKQVRANPIRVRQMLDNLIGNAIKYTPEQGRVQVSMLMQENQVVFRVEDTGPGIPLEEQAHIFEKFYRASNRPATAEGTGLGLAIVKSIVDSHQGRVWVESKPNEGSAFVVLLPTIE
jgi:signal transduction histidine kinase